MKNPNKMSKWHIKQNAKSPRYYCTNCTSLFYTGRFDRRDSDIFDDICPYCGFQACDLRELAVLYQLNNKED